jgi:hypothetical protein
MARALVNVAKAREKQAENTTSSLSLTLWDWIMYSDTTGNTGGKRDAFTVVIARTAATTLPFE